jgi:antitoxin component YwqK of YwqJK toxin-antitoxin module
VAPVPPTDVAIQPPAATIPAGVQPATGRETLAGGIVVEKQTIPGPQGAVNFGHWKATYADGRLLGEGEFVNGKRHGKWTRWYAPGEAPMFDNPLYGRSYAWFFSEAYFDNGVLHGPWVVMDGNKKVLSIWEFRGGKQDGPWVWYYPTGAKRREAIYAGGQLVEAVNFAPDGRVTAKEVYVDGRQKDRHERWSRLRPRRQARRVDLVAPQRPEVG